MQATAGRLPALALARLWAEHAVVPSASLVLTVYDEIVVECDAADGERVAAWLREHMQAAATAIMPDVPVVVDVTIARDWSGKEEA